MTSEFPEHPAYAIASGLLDYALIPNPFPLQANPPTGTPTITRLDMVVSAPPGNPVKCSKVEITLPIGTSAQSLVDTATGITARPPAGWQSAVTSTDTNAVITFTPPGNSFDFDEDGINLSIGGLRVNKTPGNAELRITEHPVAVKSPIVIVLAKQPYRPPIPAGSPNRFSARRWAGDTLSPSPATQVTAGQKVTLTWQTRTGVERHLFAQPLNSDVGATGQDVSRQTRVDSAPVVRPTTFTLRTKVLATGETMYDTVTVTVDTPTFAGLFLNGPLSAGATGTVTFPDTVTVPMGLTVHGALTARGGVTAARTFKTKDKLTASQGITVDGAASAGGNSTVPGGVEAAGITTQNLVAKKTVKIIGSVSKHPYISFNSPAATTDQLLLGYIERPPQISGRTFGYTAGDFRVLCSTRGRHVQDAVCLPARAGEKRTGQPVPLDSWTHYTSRLVVATFGSSF